MTQSPADTPQVIDTATAKTSKQRKINALIQASPSVMLLRDGELVLYRRTRSLLYQCRFKLANGKWHRYATFELLREGTDIHTLSKQMGNSAAMIERHHSKLTATMAADRLA